MTSQNSFGKGPTINQKKYYLCHSFKKILPGFFIPNKYFLQAGTKASQQQHRF